MRQPLPLLAGLTVSLLLSGCSSQGGVWSQYAQLVRQAIKPNKQVTRAEAASVPFASLGYRVDGGRETILVLATDDNGNQIWTAATHVVLQTRDGRIVRTVGLPHDVAATAAQGRPALPALAGAIREPYRSTRLMDFPDIGVYGLTLNCLTTARGPQTITIIGTAIKTTRIDEICQSANPRWNFTDSYWIDAETGFTWHSVQHLHPKGTIIQTEVFRPPG